MLVRKFSLSETETISADILQSQLELPASTTVGEIVSGHVVAGHIDTLTDMVSVCALFTDDANGEYLNIWSVVTQNNALISASASLEFEVG